MKVIEDGPTSQHLALAKTLERGHAGILGRFCGVFNSTFENYFPLIFRRRDEGFPLYPSFEGLQRLTAKSNINDLFLKRGAGALADDA